MITECRIVRAAFKGVVDVINAVDKPRLRYSPLRGGDAKTPAAILGKLSV